MHAKFGRGPSQKFLTIDPHMRAKFWRGPSRKIFNNR